MFPEGSGGSGEDPSVGESEQENEGNISYCSHSGNATHTSGNSIIKADRKLMWHLTGKSKQEMVTITNLEFNNVL